MVTTSPPTSPWWGPACVGASNLIIVAPRGAANPGAAANPDVHASFTSRFPNRQGAATALSLACAPSTRPGGNVRMNRRFLQWLVAPALVAGLVTTGVATGPPAGASVAHAKKLKSATLNGSGSTFQLAYDQAAIQAFTTNQPDVTINYAGGGFGKGRQDFADQVVDFAGTDAAYPSADLAKVKGGDFFYIPTVVAPDHRLVQPERCEEAAALRRARSPRSSSSRSRSGTTPRSRPTTRTPRCRARTSPSPGGPTARARRRTSRPSSRRPLRRTGSSAPARRSTGRPAPRAAPATPASRTSSRRPTVPSATSTSRTPRPPASRSRR